MKPFHKYEIKFLDIKQDNNWCDFGEEIEPSEVIIIGYLVKEDKLYYVFAEGFSDDSQYFSQTAIPKGCITDIREL